MIFVTSKPAEPKTATRTSEGCAVLMWRCWCGLIWIGGSSGGQTSGGIVAGPSGVGFRLMNVSLVLPS